MKTSILSLLLSAAFLSAGAFAGNNVPPKAHSANITVVFKGIN